MEQHPWCHQKSSLLMHSHISQKQAWKCLPAVLRAENTRNNSKFQSNYKKCLFDFGLLGFTFSFSYLLKLAGTSAPVSEKI